MMKRIVSSLSSGHHSQQLDSFHVISDFKFDIKSELMAFYCTRSYIKLPLQQALRHINIPH